MANFNFNKVMLGGHLTGDPELKQAQNGDPIASAIVAINRRMKQGQEQQSDSFRLVAFRQQAEFLCKYFRKRSSIFVVGRAQNNNWTDQQGAKHYSTDIILEDIQFVDSKTDTQGTGYVPVREPTQSEIRQAAAQQAQAYVPSAYMQQADASAPEELAAPDELPF